MKEKRAGIWEKVKAKEERKERERMSEERKERGKKRTEERRDV